MFPALLAAVAAIAFSVLSGQAPEAQQTKQVSRPAVSARSADYISPRRKARRPPTGVARSRRRSPARATVQARRLSSDSGAHLPGSPSRSFRTGRSEPGPAETTRCAASPSPSRRRPAVAGAPRLRTGNWPTGMSSLGSRPRSSIAFAPFVLRPRRLGEHRVAVILPTLTWQAYNFRDDDGDGASDTWYADGEGGTFGSHVRFVTEACRCGSGRRPPFLHWLAWNQRPVDYLAQADLERVSDARRLRRAYDLIIFPGHHEYVTSREFGLVMGFRNLGGNLMFLSANNFFWRVERDGSILRLIAMWRDLGRPEAALVGVQYVAYGSELRGPYVVRRTDAAPWLFRGTGLRNGSSFGSFGIEVDRTTARLHAGSECWRRSGTGSAVRSRAR